MHLSEKEAAVKAYLEFLKQHTAWHLSAQDMHFTDIQEAFMIDLVSRLRQAEAKVSYWREKAESQPRPTLSMPSD